MNRFDFFKLAIKHELYKYTDWVISVLAQCELPSITEVNEPKAYYLYKEEKSDLYFFYDPNENALVQIEDTKQNQPLFNPLDGIALNVGDLPNVKTAINTTIGNTLLNAIMLVYPFGSKVAFITGKMQGKDIEKQLVKRLKTRPKDKSKESDADLYIDELVKFADAVTQLEYLTPVVVPSGSPKTATINPAILKRRDELYAQHAGKLNDPAIEAEIMNELIALDKKDLEGDVSMGFFTGAKAFDVSRKKRFISIGKESGFSDHPIVKQSLMEGMRIEDIPASAEAIRHASASRGHQTALGGELVKYLYRIFQNTKIVMDDCGVRQGGVWQIHKENAFGMIGRYLIEGTKQTLITEETYKNYIGKTIMVRTPQICQAPKPSFCAMCLGPTLNGGDNSLHIAAANIASIIMNIFMKAMHGKALKTKHFDYQIEFT